MYFSPLRVEREFTYMIEESREILKVIVGSHAHGLATPESDYDYRGVFAYPTSRILSLFPPTDHTSWIEGKTDDTSWELHKFLFLSTKCNPTILETFLAPLAPQPQEFIPTYQKFTLPLRELFPHVWNSTAVKDAFVGYGINQRKKFFDNRDKRAPKYACAYLRVLYNAWELLSTGTFNVDLTDTPVYEACKRFKRGDYTPGEVINECFKWETEVLKAYKQNPDKKTNFEPINEFLLKVRKELWT